MKNHEATLKTQSLNTPVTTCEPLFEFIEISGQLPRITSSGIPFGRSAAWTGFVLPSLVLGYFGQGALVLAKPKTFFRNGSSRSPDLLTGFAVQCGNCDCLWIAVGGKYGSGLPANTGNAFPAFLLAQYGPQILNAVNLDRGRLKPNFA